MVSIVDADALQKIPQLPVLDALDMPPFTNEFKTVILQMNLSKATVQDIIPFLLRSTKV